MGQAIIGVDVGTGSARAGVFDAEGRLLASARRPIRIWRASGGGAEHSSSDIWSAACAAVGEALQRSDIPPTAIDGIGFDATCSLVVVDEAGEPLPVGPSGDRERDTIVWMDHRAVAEASEINAAGYDFVRYAGGAVSPEMQAPKLLWLKRHMPRTFAAVGHLFDLADFLTWRASGSLARSACTVACKWPYLGPDRRWSTEFFEAVGLERLAADGFRRIGAEIVAPGASLGAGLRADAAASMGLVPGIPVAAGLIDAHAGALATIGAAEASEPVDVTRRVGLVLGTSSCCMTFSDAPLFIPGVWGPYFNAVTPGQWLNEAGQSAFGATLDHLMRLHPARAEIDFEAIERAIVAEAGGYSRGALLAQNLHVLPDFLGNRTPRADPTARGGIVGLDLVEDEESRRALYVAGICGLAQGIAQCLRALESSGRRFDRIVVSGGASKSALIRQIVADATGRRVSRTATSEPVLLGAAMLGAVAGGWGGLAEVMSRMTRIEETRAPADGEIARFHDRKRAALEILQRADADLRKAMGDGGPETTWPALVIFDCDGVLVDSEAIALRCAQEAFAELGVDLSPEQTARLFLGVSQAAMRVTAQSALGVDLPQGFEARLTERTLAAFERELKGMEGLREALGGLGAPVCVASSSPLERIRASLSIVGYADLFGDKVFSAADVMRGKPEPDLFLHAAERLGVAPARCLVIEDSAPGVLAARRAGMTVFGFTGGAHAQGEDYRQRLNEAGAAAIFEVMRELPELINRTRARGYSSLNDQSS